MSQQIEPQMDVLLRARYEPQPPGLGLYLYAAVGAIVCVAAASRGIEHGTTSFFLFVISILLWRNLYRQSPIDQKQEEHAILKTREEDRQTMEQLKRK